MAIKFNQFQSKIEEIYTPRAEDEKRFAAKHVVAVTKDAAGNPPDFATKGMAGKKKRLADTDSEEQKKVYEYAYPYVPNQIAYEDDDSGETEVEPSEPAETDYEGEMAKAELRAVASKAGALAQMMDDEMELEAWLQSKISVAKKDIDTVYDYVVFSMMPRMNTEEFESALEMLSEEALEEVLRKSDSAGKWISDFVHSDNPKFKGKSKKQRMKQALAAYYAKQRNESVEMDEARRSEDYLGTVHKDDPDYDKKIAAYRKDHVVRIRGRAPKPEHKDKYKRGGELYRSSSQDVKPEHASRVDIYSRGKKKNVKEEVELEEGVVDVYAHERKDDSHKLQDWSKAKLDKYRKMPHGSHSNKDIEDEHKRRIRTSEYEMRSKEPVKEEVESINELSKKTMLSYVDKALRDKRRTDRAHGAESNKPYSTSAAGKSDFSIKQLGKESDKRHKGIVTATKKLAKEEVEQIDELSKKTLGSYIKKSAEKVHKSSFMAAKDKPENAAKHGMDSYKRIEGIRKATDKLTKEEVELEEAKRGRPRKDGTSSGEDEGGREHIVMQLRKAINLRGQKHVEFNSGEKHQVPVEHAKKALDMHDSMKKAEDKQEFAARLAKSHGSFKDAISGKPAEPKKPKITLAKFAGKK